MTTTPTLFRNNTFIDDYRIEMVDKDTWIDDDFVAIDTMEPTELKLYCLEKTVFGDQDTELCCEQFATDYKEMTGVSRYDMAGANIFACWNALKAQGWFHDEDEDIDYRSGDVSTHEYMFLDSPPDIDDCEDYPRVSEDGNNT